MIGITQHKVFDHVELIGGIINANVYLRFSETIITCCIVVLLDLYLIQRVVGSISDLWLQGIDATILKPLVAPLVEIKCLAHAGIIPGLVSRLKSTNEVRELGISPLILREVLMESRFQSVLTNYFIGLLQE